MTRTDEATKTKESLAKDAEEDETNDPDEDEDEDVNVEDANDDEVEEEAEAEAEAELDVEAEAEDDEDDHSLRVCGSLSRVRVYIVWVNMWVLMHACVSRTYLLIYIFLSV